MAEERSTNEKIAGLLKEQTYGERMEFAETVRDYIADWSADNADRSPDRDEIAAWFESLSDTYA